MSSTPSVEEVTEGIWSLQLSMPRMGHVFVYVLEAGDRLVLIDAGHPGEDCRAELEAALSTLGAGLEDVAGVLLTHGHMDHFGQLAEIRGASGAWSAMHPADASVGLSLRLEDAALTRRWASELGLGDDESASFVEMLETIGARRLGLDVDRALAGGDVVTVGSRTLRVLHTPGHSPGHLCFVCDDLGLVFSGDHVLSETTPNVSVRPGVDESPLDDYLRSLEALAPLRGMTTLPGHERRIDPAERAPVLIEHHARQLTLARDLVASGRTTVRAVAEEMEWSQPWSGLGTFDVFLALGETLAHLIVLEGRGELVCERGAVHEWQPA